MSCEAALRQPAPQAPKIDRLLLVAAAALIDPDGRILLSQRPKGKWLEGYWEFPGGKIEEGEVPEYALMRELKEELGIETRPSCFTPIGFASHFYEDRHTHVLMPLFACRFWESQPKGVEGQSLKWVRVQEMYQLDLIPADIPLLPQLEMAV
jgi:8-oxo-dGTP diphosphatase